MKSKNKTSARVRGKKRAGAVVSKRELKKWRQSKKEPSFLNATPTKSKLVGPLPKFSAKKVGGGPVSRGGWASYGEPSAGLPGNEELDPPSRRGR